MDCSLGKDTGAAVLIAMALGVTEINTAATHPTTKFPAPKARSLALLVYSNIWNTKISNTISFLSFDLSRRKVKLHAYLHTQAGFGPGKRQNFDLYSLPFAHNISNISNTSLSAKLRNMDQAFPAFPVDTQKKINIKYHILLLNQTFISFNSSVS